jgi:Fe(3+) dicitrate transport protein
MLKYLVLTTIISTSLLAQNTLDTIEVESAKENSFFEFWEENQGTKIFSGKKNTVTDLKQIPQLQTNNYRLATSQTPGLLISEVPNESLAAITYRGLGNPHESYNLLLLQDGLPVAADMYGYPAHYFSPALPMMEKVQFIRGGGALLYGPQPAGVLNYMSYPLLKDQQLHGRVSLTGGSYNLLATNNAVYGSHGNNAYGVEYFRRQGDGPQRTNSDFYADYVQLRNHTFLENNLFKVAFNGYNSDHGETGGFSREAGTDLNPFGRDQKKASKEHDRLKVSRAQLAGGVESRLDDSSLLHINLWANAYRRYSKRQSMGTAPSFGGLANGATNQIVTQDYYGYNGEIRYLKNYKALGEEHTFSAGYLNYNLISPLVQELGQAPDANSGDVQRRLERITRTNSLFMENRFTAGRLMITPGVRIENIQQTIDERVSPNAPLRDADETVNVPLLGLGLAYHITDESQFYGNISESYKPVSFAEAVPLNSSTTISEDIKPSEVITYELGYRGQASFLNWDISAFLIRYENKFGEVGTGAGINYQNTGAGTHKGFDLAGEFKLSEIFLNLRQWGNFNFYTNFALLDAHYTRGEFTDKTPMYAPKTITRAGIIYNRENLLKLALMGVVVGEHYGNDNNTEDFKIPSYTVFDLTTDWNLTSQWMLSAGINNLLDRQYYSRVRAEGIQWAMGRNFYAGLNYKF